MKFNVGDIVWIKWEDHYHNYTAGWHSEEDRVKTGQYSDPIYIETVGIVLRDDKHRVVLTPTFAPDDQYSNGGWAVKIKKCIVDHKILKKAKVKK